MIPNGLINQGNICYLNSALQVLYSIVPLRKYLLSGEYIKDIAIDNKLGHQGKFINTLASFFKSYETNSPDITPLLHLLSSNFRFGEQHDSHEVLTYLLDNIHEDVNTKGSVISDIFYGKLGSCISCEHCDYTSHNKNIIGGLQLDIPNWSEYLFDVSKVSLINSVIVGLKGIVNGKCIGSKVFICTRRYMSSNDLIIVVANQLKINPENINRLFITRNGLKRQIFDSEFVLLEKSTIEVDAEKIYLQLLSDKTMSISDSIKQYFTSEVLDEWKCEKCLSFGGRRIAVIDDLPQYLIVNIKLFELGYYGYVKKSDNMTFPDVLNLSGYVNNLNNATYSVVATINHMGNTFFGHYFSFVNFEDKWYCCNDQSIQECSEEDIHRKDVYIIIYKRIIAQ